MKTVTVTMGAQGVHAIDVAGVPMILQANAPPDLVAAATMDDFGNRVQEDPAVISAGVSGNTVIQVYQWGEIRTTYTGGSRLAIKVEVINTGSRAIDHLWFYALGLELPREPVNYNPSYCATFNMDAPSSIWWDLAEDGTIDLVNDDVVKPLCLAWYKVTSSTMAKQFISLAIDSGQSVSTNWPPTPRPIPPGGCDTYTVSLRFGVPGEPETVLAADVFMNFAFTFPRVVKVPRPNKPIAAINMTSAHFVDGVRTPYPTNPRGWWNKSDIDVLTEEGVAYFQNCLLGSADTTIGEMQRVGAMGCIFWDLEGQEFDAAYIGDPVQMENVAPELVGVIDEFLRRFTDAGYAIGFCLRPQEFNFGTVQQVNTDDPGAVLYGKIKYAVDRWGASLFYVDSNLDYEGILTPAHVFESLQRAFPDVMIFPEWETTRYYASSVPYNNASNNLFGAPASALKVYGDAVSLVKVNDPAAEAYPDQIKAGAEAGNILLFDGWYPHPANDLVKKIYEEMGSVAY